MKIREALSRDWDSINNIFLLGIETNLATFETTTPNSYEDWIKKLDKKNTFVAINDEEILGWITISGVSSRSVYEGVGEVSLYVHPKHQRSGVGEQLYNYLEINAKKSDYWTLQAQLFTKNIKSKKFFEKMNFRQVGVRKKIGQLKNVWIDNYLYEKNFI